MQTKLELKLLGIPELHFEGELLASPSPKNLAILCYLAFRGEARERSELLELFWKAGKPSNLRFALFKLRDLTGSDSWLETADKLVHVHANTDVARFETALKEKRFLDALAVWQTDEADKTLLHSLSLKDAPAFQSWLELERSRLTQLYWTALQEGIDELETARKYEEALKLARGLLEKDKLNETAHRAIMRLEHRLGNTEAALAQFELCRQILQEELAVEPLEDTLSLLREIEQPSISNAKTAFILDKGTTIAAHVPKLFGRDKLIRESLEKLERQPILLQGFGGAGKTALAASVSAEYLQKNDAKALWIQAGDDHPDVLFDVIARSLDIQKEINQLEFANKASALKTHLEKQAIELLVIDDVWNAYALSKLRELLPKFAKLLVTSRQRYPQLTRLSVGKLERSAALDLLSHHADTNLKEDEISNQLCHTLGDHAFALRIAGITLNVDQQTPKTLLEQITHAPHSMKTPEDFKEEGRENITALLTMSVNALSEEAYEAFMGMGALFTSSCTPELLSFCIRREHEKTEEALFELQKRGLAERLSQSGSDTISYKLHDLAYSFSKENNHYRQSSADRACSDFLAKYRHSFEMLDLEIEQILLNSVSQNERNANSFLDTVKKLVLGKSYYLARGHSPRSLSLLKKAVGTAKELEDFDTAHFLASRLGDTYRSTYAKHKEALAAYRKALIYAEKAKNDHRIAVSRSLVGLAMFDLGIAEAKEHLDAAYQHALDSEDLLAQSHILQNMSYVAGVAEDFESALFFCEQGVLVARKLNNLQSQDREIIDPHHFYSLFNLGVAEQRLGRLDNSLKKFEDAYGLAERLDNQVWMAYVLQEQGELFHQSSEKQLAQTKLVQALSLYEKNQIVSEYETLKEFMRKQGYASSDKLA